jgi:hypothetical protein
MMNGKLLALAMAVMSGAAWAQIGELYNVDMTVNDRVDDPARLIKKVDGQWLAFEMPVLQGTRSPCCWKGRWGATGEAGCSLDNTHTSYRSRSDSPQVDAVFVYARVTKDQVKTLRVFGEQCPVDGGGAQVTLLNDVDQSAVLDWLEELAMVKKGNGAMYALALHRSDDAANSLYRMVKEAGKKSGSEAVFWLGEARGQQGFKLLKRLLGELPRGNTRREINFALAMNDSPEAADLLYEISQNDQDPEQRGEALFWLAQEYPQEAKGWLQEVINNEQDEHVLDQAIFAVSQLPGNDSSQMLLEIAQDKDAPREARRQALFWLAQSDDDEAVAALADLLTR